jgi:hypothetical protein
MSYNRFYSARATQSQIISVMKPGVRYSRRDLNDLLQNLMSEEVANPIGDTNELSLPELSEDVQKPAQEIPLQKLLDSGEVKYIMWTTKVRGGFILA